MRTYVIKKVENAPTENDWNIAEVAQIQRAPWGDAVFPYTMEARLLHTDEAIYVNFITNEKNLRAVNTKRNGENYKDSCMELFIRPDIEDDRYMNFEINPLGVLYLGVRTGRYDNTLDTTDDSVFEIKSIITHDTWQVTFKIPYDVIKKYYNNITNEMRANMYKCGEQTEVNHYGCWNEVGVEHEFHAPEYFGKFILE